MKEQYAPSAEEVNAAEESMTREQVKGSEIREADYDKLDKATQELIKKCNLKKLEEQKNEKELGGSETFIIVGGDIDGVNIEFKFQKLGEGDDQIGGGNFQCYVEIDGKTFFEDEGGTFNEFYEKFAKSIKFILKRDDSMDKARNILYQINLISSILNLLYPAKSNCAFYCFGILV